MGKQITWITLAEPGMREHHNRTTPQLTNHFAPVE